MQSRNLKVVALTQGDQTPSSRFRWKQYEKDLVKSGIDAVELPSRVGAYAPERKILRPLWLAQSLVENLGRVVRAGNCDVAFLQRNLTATLCTWEPNLSIPFVFDVDDAIFLGSRGQSANRIARHASVVICGNNYLAEHFSKFNRVVVLPTAVDATRYSPGVVNETNKKIIGWSGSSSGFKYLYMIEPAIRKLLNMHSGAIFKIIADKRPLFKTLPPSRVIFEPWSPSTEVIALQDITVGIMPLIDDPWARGKCSFKMLTYMACGVPVVVSPVGMNSEVLMQGSCGFGASSEDEWVDTISSLLTNQELSSRMGAEGRAIVERYYSKAIVAPKLASILLSQL